MRIGIPRALLYYYYYPFWKTLFEDLGFEVVLSDETNAKIISEGSSATVSELCVPIKIFNGHVLDLIEKDVDYIFVPQFISLKKEWYCPKFLGLAEIAEYSISGLKEKILAIELRSKDDVPDVLSNYLPLCEKLHITKQQLQSALKKARKAFLSFRELCTSGYTITEAYDILDGKDVALPQETPEITIGLMGYVNNVYDNFVSMNTIKKLREMHVKVITFDMLDEEIVKLDKSHGKQPFWVFARKIYNAAEYLLNNKKVDGFIHLTAFGCGPDSIIGRMMELDCAAQEVPFMTIRVDEHTGESHIQTRLEAFIDMLKISKNKAVDLV